MVENSLMRGVATEAAIESGEAPGSWAVTEIDYQGFTSITLEFELTRNIDQAAADVQAAITRTLRRSRARATPPSGRRRRGSAAAWSRSTATAGSPARRRGSITLEFELTRNIDQAAADVQAAITRTLRRLPIEQALVVRRRDRGDRRDGREFLDERSRHRGGHRVRRGAGEFTSITLEFELTRNIDQAAADVQAAITRTLRRLPRR
jgi:multidrug efflux pump subunit AcrB